MISILIHNPIIRDTYLPARKMYVTVRVGQASKIGGETILVVLIFGCHYYNGHWACKSAEHLRCHDCAWRVADNHLKWRHAEIVMAFHDQVWDSRKSDSETSSRRLTDIQIVIHRYSPINFHRDIDMNGYFAGYWIQLDVKMVYPVYPLNVNISLMDINIHYIYPN